MPEFFEEAAHLLHILTRMGLIIPSALDARILVFKVALHMHRRKTHDRTDAEAAADVLTDLMQTKGVVVLPKRRAKMIATIGTYFANHIDRQAA